MLSYLGPPDLPHRLFFFFFSFVCLFVCFFFRAMVLKSVIGKTTNYSTWFLVNRDHRQ